MIYMIEIHKFLQVHYYVYLLCTYTMYNRILLFILMYAYRENIIFPMDTKDKEKTHSKLKSPVWEPKWITSTLTTSILNYSHWPSGHPSASIEIKQQCQTIWSPKFKSEDNRQTGVRRVEKAWCKTNERYSQCITGSTYYRNKLSRSKSLKGLSITTCPLPNITSTAWPKKSDHHDVTLLTFSWFSHRN